MVLSGGTEDESVDLGLTIQGCYGMQQQPTLHRCTCLAKLVRQN